MPIVSAPEALLGFRSAYDTIARRASIHECGTWKGETESLNSALVIVKSYVIRFGRCYDFRKNLHAMNFNAST